MASTLVITSPGLHEATGAAAALIAFTGLAAGTARYAATLLGVTEGQIERATAIGFFFGLIFGCSAFTLEAAV